MLTQFWNFILQLNVKFILNVCWVWSVFPETAAVWSKSGRFKLGEDIQLVFFFLACPGEAHFWPYQTSWLALFQIRVYGCT